MSAERSFADTNLFLRYLTNDIPKQAEAFESLLKQAEAGEFAFVTTSLVIAEIVWTLESYYKLSKAEIHNNLLAILNTPGLEVEDDETILQAVIWYVEKNVDFIDAYNVAWMLQHNVNKVVTYDYKHFRRFKEITTLVPGA